MFSIPPSGLLVGMRRNVKDTLQTSRQIGEKVKGQLGPPINICVHPSPARTYANYIKTIL